MKDALLIVLLSLAARLAAAQPVIFDGSALAPVGWSWPIHEALATSTVSSGGANQLWDLSSLSTTVIGTMSITWPDSTPLRNSFPDANFAHTFAGTSSFYNLLPDRLEVSAYNITTAGVGNDYSLNPRNPAPVSISISGFCSRYMACGGVYT
jgi:hypothetical protein